MRRYPGGVSLLQRNRVWIPPLMEPSSIDLVLGAGPSILFKSSFVESIVSTLTKERLIVISPRGYVYLNS